MLVRAALLGAALLLTSVSGAAAVVSQVVATAPLANPATVATAGGDGRVYVGTAAGGVVARIDAAGGGVLQRARPGGGRVSGLAVDPARDRLYDIGPERVLMARDATTLDVRDRLDLAAGGPPGGVPVALGVEPGSGRIVVLSDGVGGRGELLVVEPDLRIRSRVELPGAPSGLAVDPGGGRAYVTLRGRSALAMVDLARPGTIAEVQVGAEPIGVVVLVRGTGVRLVVTANRRGRDITSVEVRGDALRRLGRREVGAVPTAIAADGALPTGSEIAPRVHVSAADGGLTVFQRSDATASGLTTLERVALEGPLGAVAVDTRSHRVVAASSQAGRATLVSRFEPMLHGFSFPQTFQAPEVDLAIGSFRPPGVYGMCGGVAFTAIDTFRAGAVRPNEDEEPPTAGVVFDYVFLRLVDSITGGSPPMFARYIDHDRRGLDDVLVPFTSVVLQEGLRTVTARTAQGALPDLDRGRPVPLGVILAEGVFADPFRDHVVTAVGHFLTPGGERVIEVYDPNFPNRLSFYFTQRRIVATDRQGTPQRVIDAATGEERDLTFRGLISAADAYAARRPPWADGPVGTPRLLPGTTVRASRSGRATVTLRWTSPTSWRSLRHVDLRLSDGSGVIGTVRLDRGRTLGVVGPSGGGPSGAPGSARILRRGPVSVDLRGSRVVRTGAGGRTVTMRVVLRLRGITGRAVRLDAGATGITGNRQPPRPVGRITLPPR